MKGKWAQGIEPRNFAWVVKDKFAVCERPGGYGANHRRVRRQEEIIWIREQGFTCVISLIPSPHNLHNYDELGVTWRHRPFASHDDEQKFVAGFFPEFPTVVPVDDRTFRMESKKPIPILDSLMSMILISPAAKRGTVASSVAVTKQPGWPRARAGTPLRCSGRAQANSASRCGAP
jgi:hypothetical protein